MLRRLLCSVATLVLAAAPLSAQLTTRHTLSGCSTPVAEETGICSTLIADLRVFGGATELTVRSAQHTMTPPAWLAQWAFLGGALRGVDLYFRHADGGASLVTLPAPYRLACGVVDVRETWSKGTCGGAFTWTTTLVGTPWLEAGTTFALVDTGWDWTDDEGNYLRPDIANRRADLQVVATDPLFGSVGDPTTTAPEPATLVLLAGGLVGLVAVRRRV